jgi:hypothetical protein
VVYEVDRSLAKLHDTLYPMQVNTDDLFNRNRLRQVIDLLSNLEFLWDCLTIYAHAAFVPASKITR